ncbi:MAG: YgaP-like transmembrane domain [Candidatus Nanohaloarchaea archaeon]
MEKTVGDTDRDVRTALGVVSGGLAAGMFFNLMPEGLALPDIAAPVLAVVAVVLLATAFTEKCAIYSALGMDTR